MCTVSNKKAVPVFCDGLVAQKVDFFLASLCSAIGPRPDLGDRRSVLELLPFATHFVDLVKNVWLLDGFTVQAFTSFRRRPRKKPDVLVTC